ncbi:Gfo/Idh/MocA family oxidoreductase [Tropicibacter sp. R15_0]|uniref:Gfo/Idh/MocA family protein n=1 Tax=Tropicibacter sp. R15_0 TaxID=2821101 RepID=UPI00257118D4|nr:Gfo/Idh/MocA family oxidoreductase [Tropicibacter sp. R15_0]
MSIRIAIIGAGIMGADHAAIVAQDLPGATLQAVCDMDSARARKIADDHGVADIANDPESVISRSDMDAVIVASPDFTHAPLSKACIAAGKPVLCEKPLSQSSDECIEVMQLEEAAGHPFVMLGFMRRYDQSYTEMKAALTSGRLGRALMMHNFHRNVETPAADFTGAMAITNSAPHEFDVARHVLGAEFSSIIAQQARRSDGVVAPVVMVLETDDGQLVTVEDNNNAARMGVSDVEVNTCGWSTAPHFDLPLMLNAPVQATTSLLENGSLMDIAARSWSYITLGFGHGEEWWRQFCYRLKMAGYDGWLSIEHEDVPLNSLEGLKKPVSLLQGIMPVSPSDHSPQDI